ncbi:MAG: hypothetical protein OXC44_08425 [Proteobacteria bacterium]|nr:hypothetical protein [Pseudomonadota bacterium]
MWTLFFSCLYSCAKPTTSGTGPPQLSDLNQADADISLEEDNTPTIDPSTLIIKNVSANYISKKTLNPNLIKVDLLATIEPGPNVLYFSVKVCDDKKETCKKQHPHYSSLRIEAAGLTETGVIQVAGCTIYPKPGSSSPCGPVKEVPYILPPKSTDITLQGYERERAKLQAQLAKYDPEIHKMVTTYQETVDKCMKNNQQAAEAQFWKSLATPILGGLAGSFFPPSEDITNPPGWGVDLEDIKGALNTSATTETWKKGTEMGKLGYGSAELFYKVRAAKKAWQKYKTLKSIPGKFKNIYSQIMQGGGLFSKSNFNNLLNFIDGPDSGSAGGFITKAASAVYDLFSTHVTLPCAQRQFTIDLIDNTLSSILADTRATLCTLETNIKTHKESLGIEDKFGTPNCEESSTKDQESKTEDQK